MSNTHLSLLENYSTVNTFMICIYIYTYYIIHIQLETWICWSKTPENPTRNNIEWFQRSVLSLQAISIKVPVWNKGGEIPTTRADLATIAIQPAMPGRLLDGEAVRSRRRCELIPPFLFLNLKSLGLTQIWGERTWFIIGGLEVEAVCVFVFFFPGTKKGLGCVFFFPSAIVLNCVVTFSGQ